MNSNRMQIEWMLNGHNIDLLSFSQVQHEKNREKDFATASKRSWGCKDFLAAIDINFNSSRNCCRVLGLNRLIVFVHKLKTFQFRFCFESWKQCASVFFWSPMKSLRALMAGECFREYLRYQDIYLTNIRSPQWNSLFFRNARFDRKTPKPTTCKYLCSNRKQLE